MVLQGRIKIENLSAVKVQKVGVRASQDAEGRPVMRDQLVTESYGDAPVRLNETVVPQRVAYVIEGSDSSPSLRVEFELRDGTSVVCTRVEFEASADGRGIQTGDLTTLPSLRTLGEDAFLSLAMQVAESPYDWAIDPTDRKRRRTARQDIHTRGDAELKEVARVYRENVAGHPVEAVEELGYSRRTAARRIEQARGKGFLPPTTRGRKNA